MPARADFHKSSRAARGSIWTRGIIQMEGSVLSRIGTGSSFATSKSFVFTAGRLIDYDEEVCLPVWAGDAPSHSINGPGITRAWSTIMPSVLKSPAFDPGAVIPRRHTGDGEDLSPPLAWSGLPPEPASSP